MKDKIALETIEATADVSKTDALVDLPDLVKELPDVILNQGKYYIIQQSKNTNDGEITHFYRLATFLELP